MDLSGRNYGNRTVKDAGIGLEPSHAFKIGSRCLKPIQIARRLLSEGLPPLIWIARVSFDVLATFCDFPVWTQQDWLTKIAGRPIQNLSSCGPDMEKKKFLERRER